MSNNLVTGNAMISPTDKEAWTTEPISVNQYFTEANCGHHPSHLGRSLWLVGLSIFVRIWGQWTREKNIGLFAYWTDQVNKFNRLLLMIGICERFLLTICWRWLSQVKENASGKKASIMEVKRAINQIIPQCWPSIYIYKYKKCL